MKKLIVVALISLFAATFINTVAVANYYPDENWEISNFHSSILLDKDGTIRVTESIVADFTNEQHHGIVRSIPYRYNSNYSTTRNIKISFIEAKDENGKKWDTSVSKNSDYYEITMRTKDDSFLTSTTTFNRTYEAERVFNFFTTTESTSDTTPEFFPHTELYWNVTGTEWVVPIKKASTEIHLPTTINESDIKTLCYTGIFGSEEQNCKIKQTSPTIIEFTTTKELQRKEGLTSILAIPNGIIDMPSSSEKIMNFIKDNYVISFPILVLIGMIILWFFTGRDPKTTKDTIIPHYKAPQNLKPIECGTIIDEQLHPRDITSTIIDLAIRGFFRIEESEEKGLFGIVTKKYKFILEKEDWHLEKLEEFEQKIMETVFPSGKKETTLEEIQKTFYKIIPSIGKSVMEKLVKDNYFPNSPVKTRMTYVGIGIFIVFISAGIIDNFTAESGGIITIMLVICGAIIAMFSRLMPRKTLKGVETYYELKGLEEYIKTAEKDRMEFQEKANIFFEKLLPYAAAFGLVKKWTETFEPLIKTPPTWYRPYHGNTFTMHYFANSLTNFTKTAENQAFNRTSKGSSAGRGISGFGGGGGFSGGGFGGGGGRGI